MKTLTELNINQELFADDLLIAEKFTVKKLINGIGNLFGGKKSDKLDDGVKNLDKSKTSFLSTSVVASKTKDKDAKQEIEQTVKDIETGKIKGDQDVLNRYKNSAESMILKKNINGNNLDWAIALKRHLKTLGESMKDNEAIELSKKLEKLINDKFGEPEIKKIEATQTKNEETIETGGKDNSNEGDKEKPKEEGEDKEGKEKVDKLEDEIQQGVKDEIKEEKDLLGPLAKQANIDGQLLLEFVSKKLTFNLLKNSKVLDKDGKEIDYKVAGKVASTAIKDLDTESDSFKNDVLGMCIVICGAIISGNGERFMKICEVLKIDEAKTADELRKQVTNFAKAERGKAISKAKKAAKRAEKENEKA